RFHELRQSPVQIFPSDRRSWAFLGVNEHRLKPALEPAFSSRFPPLFRDPVSVCQSIFNPLNAGWRCSSIEFSKPLGLRLRPFVFATAVAFELVGNVGRRRRICGNKAQTPVARRTTALHGP